MKLLEIRVYRYYSAIHMYMLIPYYMFICMNIYIFRIEIVILKVREPIKLYY